MAQASLQEMAREVHLYSGEVAPILLCKRWVRDRYRKLCEKNIWSFKLQRSAFGTTNQYTTGNVSLTFNSNSVTGSGTAWLGLNPTAVGQQLKVNNGFVFTITAVNSDTSLTIDQTWLGDNVSASTYSILQAYITPTPSDFHAFFSVVDPTNSWRLHLAYNVKDLDRIDARRAATGIAYILANGVYNASQVPAFELWPHTSSRKMYMYTYERRVPDLADTDTPPPIVRSDILIKGALADLTRWPGTPERRNPMYDPYFTHFKAREAEWEEELQKAIVEDQSIMQNDLSTGSQLRYYPIDANFMRSHSFPSF